MDLDKLLHPQKNFAELEDEDVERFLKERKFKSEHLSLEFKSQFAQKSQGKFDIREICKYIVGLSNEGGGLLIYGVSDEIKDREVDFPEYIRGLPAHPSLEDLSEWVTTRIHPLVASPAIRFFNVCGRTVAILSIPIGSNRPYCYHEPSSNAVTYYKKTPGCIIELSPDEIREFHRTHIINQSLDILRAAESQRLIPASSKNDEWAVRLQKHKEIIRPRLEGAKEFGCVGIYCWPATPVTIPVNALTRFFEKHRLDFCETFRHSGGVDQLQSGISVGFFPRAVRKDIKSTVRTTLYSDGLVSYDALADTHMEGTKGIHAGWLTYELQRNIQLAKTLYADYGTSRIHVEVDFTDIAGYSLDLDHAWQAGKYTQHERIHREIGVSEIHDYDGKERNIAMDAVADIMNEIFRVFGFEKFLPFKLWDANKTLLFVKGLESQR